MTENEKARDQVRIVAICGSLRPGSYTRMALQVALRGARETGAEATLIDPREYQLIFCDGKENESGYPKGVFRLRDEVKRAHGVILGTPEYHGGVSGVLKNALDLMGFEELEGKMIGLVGVSGGAFGSVHALSHLRTIGRALHAWVSPEQVAISEAWKAFDKEGNPTNLELEKRLLELGRQVARFSYLHTSEKALEFLRLWEGAPTNPGG
jgi:NAD(P)H-dependent FMN reductase